jgi:hypothetical protein
MFCSSYLHFRGAKLQAKAVEYKCEKIANDIIVQALQVPNAKKPTFAAVL